MRARGAHHVVRACSCDCSSDATEAAAGGGCCAAAAEPPAAPATDGIWGAAR